MLKMRRGQGNRHFQISKAISAQMKAGSTVENHERPVGVLSQAQMMRPAVVSRPVEPNPAASHRSPLRPSPSGVSPTDAMPANLRMLHLEQVGVGEPAETYLGVDLPALDRRFREPILPTLLRTALLCDQLRTLSLQTFTELLEHASSRNQS
jgi:hypothetical protein